MGEPMGPMEKGITNMVRPFMEPSYRPLMVRLRSTGSTLFGPGHITRIGSKQEADGAFLERDGRSTGDHLCHQVVVLSLAPVTPINGIRFAQVGYFPNPFVEVPVL